MYRLRLGVAALLVGLLATGWLLGDDTKGKNDKEPQVKVIKGRLPTNYKKLGLTEDQVQKIYSIQASYQAKIDELDQKKKALQKEEKAEMEKVLTEGQRLRLREILLGETGKEKAPARDKVPDKDKAPAKDK
jgi:hypothetical protein